MKVFWALMVVLVAGAGALLAMRDGGDFAPAPAVATSTAPRAPEAPARTGGAPSAVSEAQGVAAEAERIEPATEPDPVEVSAEKPAEARDEDSAGEPVEVPIGDPGLPAGATEPGSEPAPLSEDLAAAGGEAGTENGGIESAGTGEADAPAASADWASDTRHAERAGPAEAGDAMVLNGRHRVTGSGTAADPYVIDFDLLVAVEQDYAPKKEGKTEIPDWVKVLDGKHVEITGFIAFPFLAETANECMVMLNEWDGCCIGVPPTPYDAVEVQLAEPLNLRRGIPNYGTLTGVFRTDPYLVNGWLIGLYVMDEAKVTVSGSRGQTGY